MSEALLEHVNVTTSSANATAELLVSVFGWHVRSAGAGQNPAGGPFTSAPRAIMWRSTRRRRARRCLSVKVSPIMSACW